MKLSNVLCGILVSILLISNYQVCIDYKDKSNKMKDNGLFEWLTKNYLKKNMKI